MLVYLASEDTASVPKLQRTVFPTRAGFMAGTSWPTCSAPPRSFSDYVHEVEQREAQMLQSRQVGPRMP
ncbi:MAG TPA: hypothetical protein VMD31_09925 [Opitutaceae bacterium]|nr:hypothetical protein [Opitutaceae bacterium]